VKIQLRENLGLRLLSLALAVVLWFVAQGEQTYQATVLAPVEYLLPEGLVLLNDGPPPEQVVIRASGSRASLRTLQEQLRESPARFIVDVEDAEPGRTVHTFRKLPAGVGQDVIIDTISPAEVELVFDEVGERTLPVLMRTRGKLPPGFVEVARSLEPSEVTLIGAASELGHLEFIQSLPILLDSRKASFGGELGLDVGDLHLTADSPRVIRATLEVEEAVAEREYGAVPLVVGIDGVRVEPGALVVRLSGPVPVLDELRHAGVIGRLRGDRDALKFDEDTVEVDVGWTSGEDAGPPSVLVTIDHKRADELEVLGVDPKRFKVFVVEPPEPEPTVDRDPAPSDGPPEPEGD
jgi:hypothetical protein